MQTVTTWNDCKFTYVLQLDKNMLDNNRPYVTPYGFVTAIICEYAGKPEGHPGRQLGVSHTVLWQR